ncbi:M1 family metallopeptidase, partial [Bacteroidota bacterium]
MRKVFVCLIISISVIVNYGQKFQPFHIESKISQYEINKHKQLLQQISSYDNNTDIVFQRLEFVIDPSVYYISGRVTSHFKSLSNIQQISFDLSDSLIIDSVVYHRQQVEYQHSNDIVEIELNITVAENALDSVAIYYHGEPIGSGKYSFRQDNHNGTPIIYTHSEPYGSKYWWPCRQNLSDKIDSIDIIITVPDPYIAISNGILTSVKGNSSKSYYWKHRYPITTYLVAFSVTEYELHIDTTILNNSEIIEIHNYLYPEDADSLKDLTPVTIPIMNFFSEKFIPYPFKKEKYGHAQTPLRGGMENQTISFMGYFNFGLIAHELAHQWFGDYITCKNWHDIWLNEGFATYLTGLCYEELVSNESWIKWKQNQIKSITELPGGTVWVEDTTDVSRIFDHRLSYEKGAYLLHMLRWELGDSLFFQGINNYLNDAFLSNNFATTQDLIYHFEQVSDTSLTEFFNDWLYGEGFPNYTVFWIQNINNSIEFEIFQESSHLSIDFFEMHLPLQLVGINKDTLIRIHHIENGQKINLPVNFEVKS